MRLLICLLLLVGRVAFSAGNQPPIDRETVRQAIHIFRTNPDKARGQTARIIFRYSEESPDVELKISRKAVSFISNQKENFDERSTLLLAFIVGNVEAQWAHRETKDNSYAGDLQVIATYRQLQKLNPKLRIDEVEKFIELEKHGELKRYVSTP